MNSQDVELFKNVYFYGYLSNTWRVINAQSHEYFALQEEQESAKQMNYYDVLSKRQVYDNLETWDMRHETWDMRHETWDMRYETWDVWKFRDNICGQQSNIFSKPFFSVIEVDERNQPTKFYLGNISITCFIKVISCGNFVTRYVDDWWIFFHNVF